MYLLRKRFLLHYTRWWDKVSPLRDLDEQDRQRPFKPRGRSTLQEFAHERRTRAGGFIFMIRRSYWHKAMYRLISRDGSRVLSFGMGRAILGNARDDDTTCRLQFLAS